MRVRAIFGWKSFWMGVLVVAFLGWAWVRSQELYTYVGVTKAGGWGVGMGQERGEISLAFHTVGDGGFQYAEGVTPGGVRWWPGAFRKGTNDSAVYVWVAHWVAMGTCLVFWVGWMVWRWRRVRGAGDESG